VLEPFPCSVSPQGLADTSVDPTDARNDILDCVGRSDRSAQLDLLGLL